MKNVCIIAILLLVMFPVAAGAQGDEGEYDYRGGDREFTIVGSGNSDKDFEGTTFSFEGSLGYFLSEYFSFNIRQGYSYQDFAGGGSDWAASTRLGLDYNFDLDRFKPIVGASFGGVYGDTITDQFVAGPEAGVKYFANTTTFFLFLLEYQFLFDDASEADDNFDEGRFIYTLGLGFKF